MSYEASFVTTWKAWKHNVLCPEYFDMVKHLQLQSANTQDINRNLLFKVQLILFYKLLS